MNKTNETTLEEIRQPSTEAKIKSSQLQSVGFSYIMISYVEF